LFSKGDAVTRYFRVSLGKGGSNAAKALEEGWIGTGWLSGADLSGKFHDQWRDFNKEMIPVVMNADSITSKVAAGLACGMTWTVCRGMQLGDIVLSSNGRMQFQVGRVSGEYYFAPGNELPHRRAVQWLPILINRSDMSEDLSKRFSPATVQELTAFGSEIDELISKSSTDTHPIVHVDDENVENPYVFVLEKYLEDFLVSNWKHTELGKQYDIYEVDGEQIGQQYMSDTGPLDILAISKDKKTLLVVELKKGKVSDNVVGQIQRYMGYVKEELLEPGQEVRGVIIGLDDDHRIQRALAVTQGIEFYKYEVNFRLHKSGSDR
jgi:restriction system protein